MGNLHFTIPVNEDGSLTIPAFTVRGLGYAPLDEVHLAMPIDPPNCDNPGGCDELYLGHFCDDVICRGYTTDGGDVNIPVRLFAFADVPLGADIQMMAGDGALVLVAGAGICEDLPDEIEDLLDELGIKIKLSVPLGQEF